MSSYWIFGSSKPLGKGLSQALGRDHAVTRFSRKTSPSADTTIGLDLSDVVATRQKVAHQFAVSRPDGVVFCQRYRPANGLSEIDALKAGLDVELGPVLAVIDASRASAITKPMSLVLISSVAGFSAHPDISLYYHLLKATTVAATRALAAHNAKDNIRINCVVLGEYQKYPRGSYSQKEQKKFEMLERFTLSGRICTIPDIVDVVDFLLSDVSRYVTGQVVCLDGGLSGLAAESVLRSTLAREAG